MKWSPIQEQALAEVGAWIQRRDRPLFRLFGYAGTGKTELAKHLAADIDGKVIFASYTGKAALVMRERGCPEATTLHRLIYTCTPKGLGRLKELEERRAVLAARQPEADSPLLGKWSLEMKRLDQQLTEERKHVASPSWGLNMDSDLQSARLLVIDECSMVDARMADDLMKFGIPILVLGDPAQLPPVRGEGFFTRAAPDVLLTEVHRQARDSGIVQFATLVREGCNVLRFGVYGSDCEVMTPAEAAERRVKMTTDQLIVWQNKTRRILNRAIRIELGREGTLPVEGDRVICLRNDHEMGLLNGSTWTVESAALAEDDKLALAVSDGTDRVVCDAWTYSFDGRDDELFKLGWTRRDAQEFDFGYAITCHKSQGSQWGKVAVFAEYPRSKEDWKRWLYTAATRAAKKLEVIL